MRRFQARLATVILILLSAIAASCDAGSALFTKEEIDSMYEISLSQDDATLGSGAVLSASKPLSVTMQGIDGAPEASTLELSIAGAEGAEAASITFSTVAAPGAVVVKDFAKDVPPFTLPQDLAEGYYILRVIARGPSGTTLSTYSLAVLLYGGKLPKPSLAVYPGLVVAGEVSLLRLEGSVPAGMDPWVRWTLNGSVRASGYYSQRADRLAWRAPEESGVYVAKAEVFPFQPPVGFDVPPLEKAEIRMPLSTGASAKGPAPAMVPFSRLSFDGDFIDRGSRAREAEPVPLGSPALETYSSGFGYLLGDGLGAASASSLLPVTKADGGLAPFTATFLLARPADAPAGGTGTLLSVAGAASAPLLVIGVESGRPYIKAGAGKVMASAELHSSATRLAVSVSSSDKGAFARFYVDEVPAGEGLLGAALLGSIPGACVIAGEDGYRAVYDELRVFQGPYPAFRLSEEASKGASLIAASGFEGGVLGAGLETAGDVELAHGALTLKPGARLSVGTPGLPPKGSTLSYTLQSGRAAASVALQGGSALVIRSDGVILINDDDTGLRVDVRSSTDLVVALEPVKEGLRVYGSGDASVLVATPLAQDARWVLSAVGDGSAVVSKLSASVFSAPLASSRKARPAIEAAKSEDPAGSSELGKAADIVPSGVRVALLDS